MGDKPPRTSLYAGAYGMRYGFPWSSRSQPAEKRKPAFLATRNRQSLSIWNLTQVVVLGNCSIPQCGCRCTCNAWMRARDEGRCSGWATEMLPLTY